MVECERCNVRGVADRNESSKARSVGSAADETDGLNGRGNGGGIRGVGGAAGLGKGCSRLSRALCSGFRIS